MGGQPQAAVHDVPEVGAAPVEQAIHVPRPTPPVGARQIGGPSISEPSIGGPSRAAPSAAGSVLAPVYGRRLLLAAVRVLREVGRCAVLDEEWLGTHLRARRTTWTGVVPDRASLDAAPDAARAPRR